MPSQIQSALAGNANSTNNAAIASFMLGFSMSRISIHLPMPPSTNLIWRSDRGRVHKSKAYSDWLKQAGYEWLRQRKEQPRNISGNFRAILILDSTQRSRKDLDNRIKAILDFCTENQIVDDDKFCDALLVKWGLAPMGAQIILRGH